MDTPNYYFLTFCCVLFLFVTRSGVDAATCGQGRCGVGTTNQCTSTGKDCICLNNFGSRVTVKRNGSKVQLCLQSCSKEKCPANYQCSSSLCICVDGFGLSQYTGECAEKCFVQTKCPMNSHCDNTRCICDKGYLRSSHTGKCVDVDECEENPPVCGEHSVCENHPSDYSCQCREGFILSTEGNSTCLLVDIPTELGESDDPNGETPVGFYVGVTFGGLALLTLVVVVVIFIRKRRKANKSGEGTARYHHGNAEGNIKSDSHYENAGLEYEVPDLSANHCGVKTSSAEYPEVKTNMSCYKKTKTVAVASNNKKALTSFSAMKRNPVSTKSAPNQALVRTDKQKDQSLSSEPLYEDVCPGKNNTTVNMADFPKTVTPENTVQLDDSTTGNQLDAIYLNTKDKTENIIGENQNEYLMPVTSDLAVTLQNSNPNNKNNPSGFSSVDQRQVRNRFVENQNSSPKTPDGAVKFHDSDSSCTMEFDYEDVTGEHEDTYNRLLMSAEDANPHDSDTYTALDSK